MKSIPEVTAEIERYLAKGWHLDTVCDPSGRWPREFTLGTISSAQADLRYTEVQAWSHGWHDWATATNIALRQTPRLIRGTQQQLPTHVVVPDVNAAARVVKSAWTAKLTEARRRGAILTTRFGGANVAAALRLAERLDDVDFQLAITAAGWFAENPDIWPGLTPRQVPVEGLHGKWLNSHRKLVQTLAGVDELTLVQRPTRIYWTYLDPDHRRAGGRVHDSLTLGDTVPLPYKPHVVLLVENKDTAVLFPEVAGGIAVEGNGNAATGLIPQVPWITGARKIVYWGDMDARGYEIVDGLRRSIPHLQTILMDPATYDRYERYGTNTDPGGSDLARARKNLPNLTGEESVVYANLTDRDWNRHRLIEQERIPLSVAVESLSRLL